MLVEVDPDRPGLELPAAGPEPAPRVAPPQRPTTEPRDEPRRARRVAVEPLPSRDLEAWDAPDEESIYAAAEAARRLLQLAGLALEPRVAADGERLLMGLSGDDDERLRTLGIRFLDTLEALLPRAVLGLSGRHVRCRVEGAGLREARERELRSLAAELGERVRASRERQVVGPFNPAERRIIHLELRDAAGVRTESLGNGFMKRVAVEPE